MNTQQMKYFLAVARSENMTKSAEQLHIAQPALSRSISKLEQELGANLFERNGRGIRLSAEGRLAQEKLERIIGEIDALPKELEKLGEQRQSTVRIVVSAASQLSIDAISSWMALRPDVHIEMQQNAQPGNDADIVVGPMPAGPYAETRRFDERVMLAVPVEAELEDGPLALADVSSYSFIFLAGSFGFRRDCDEICSKYGFKPAVSLESDDSDAVRKMIALDLGVGFWPEHSWGVPQGSKVRLVEIAEPGFERHIHVSLLASRDKHSCAGDFYDHICKRFERAFN